MHIIIFCYWASFPAGAFKFVALCFPEEAYPLNILAMRGSAIVPSRDILRVTGISD